jgi:hypothetical protein
MAEGEETTYSRGAVQLSLFSLVQVGVLPGLCGGLTMAAGLSVLNLLPLIHPGNAGHPPLTAFVMFPGLGVFSGLLFPMTGYPLYTWVCKNKRGQKLSGIFHNPHG